MSEPNGRSFRCGGEIGTMATQAHQAEPQKPADARTSAKDVVGIIANVLSVGTATAFLLSVVYEQAYFSVVGRNFLSIASLSDYLTNVLDWLPITLGAFILYGLGVILYSTLMIPEDGKNRKVSKVPQADAAAPAGAAQTQNPSVERDTAPVPAKTILLMVVFVLVCIGVGVEIYLTSDPASDRWGSVMGLMFL